ncbi:probable calcium-binding protein CML22 [Cucurbita moschata]|uniref:Probable calcium-binding protein CML22 n=1 Tax=Cucurbita moschata TaxID=3662 RepID=A0A6J1G1T7_CUCMO|nr:probable calcium-binding protein CML22 [Cucurbita moschata]XP_022945876.1 probable calcium-binding protein CML22 [Cucurbita moschata]
MSKIGSMFFCCSSSNKYKRLDEKLGRKMLEVKKNLAGHDNFKSLNGIILRFPQFKEGLQDIRGVFEQYDEDSNGSIDPEELKKCLQQLQMHMTEEEVKDLFHSCDIDGSAGIQFNEFIVLLCLIYLLKDQHLPNISKLGSPRLAATFDTIIQAFIFLDKNGDGKLNKKEMVKALNAPCERSPARITQTRFREMDWNNSGKVNFREFLFGFINWVGIDTDDDLSLT